MKKSFKAKLSKSMMRSRVKKTRTLPTKKVFDPFLSTWVYYNENGRQIAYRNHKWEAI